MPRWTEAARQKQRERCLASRPWLRATGPKTAYGKLAVSQNARQPELFRGIEPALRRRLLKIYKSTDPQELQSAIADALGRYLDEAESKEERARRVRHLVDTHFPSVKEISMTLRSRRQSFPEEGITL